MVTINWKQSILSRRSHLEIHYPIVLEYNFPAMKSAHSLVAVLLAVAVPQGVSADLVVSGVSVDSSDGSVPLRQSIADLQRGGSAQW